MKQSFILLCLLTIICSCGINNKIPKAPITHSFFVAGPSFTGIINEDGSEGWKAEKASARDGYVLENGNILITWGKVVKEFTRDHKVVFQYDLDPINKEISCAQRLDNGHTLIVEMGKLPRLFEIDNDGKKQVEFPLQPETENTHMQTRMARKLKNGHYIVPHLLAFAVKEYTPKGEIVRTIDTDRPEIGGREAENWPFTAIVVENGNVVINLTHGNKTIEVNDKNEIVWVMSNDDVEGQIFKDPCGAQRLPNGNTVIASYAAKEGIKLFEVNRDKKIVWSYDGPNKAHHFQILTTNGKKLNGKTNT
jgi:hypothetical protein